nr:PepSY-associated TM helix domain-containing protein [uncultured Sphingomonas sp.]
MKSLSLIHRWMGGIVGLLLALLGLSGALLVWESAWIQIPGASDPVIENVQQLGSISENAAAAGAARITFASDEIGLHHVAFANSAGEYVRQDGAVAEQWSSMWARPEWWLFDFHHHLFAGETGEWFTGIAGIAGLIFSASGAILWWRSRRAFEWRLWPRKIQPGPIVRHHRDLGIVTLPLLFISFLTGLGMLYGNVARTLVGGTDPLPPPKVARLHVGPPPITNMLIAAKRRFPDAEIRRLTIPSKPGAAYSVRMRQPAEWTPNGRTTLFFDGAGRLLRVDDAALGNRGDRLIDTFYPVHTGKVGGIMWKIAMTISGLALTLLGSLAVYSFWIRRANKRRPRMAAPLPA